MYKKTIDYLNSLAKEFDLNMIITKSFYFQTYLNIMNNITIEMLMDDEFSKQLISNGHWFGGSDGMYTSKETIIKSIIFRINIILSLETISSIITPETTVVALERLSSLLFYICFYYNDIDKRYKDKFNFKINKVKIIENRLMFDEKYTHDDYDFSIDRRAMSFNKLVESVKNIVISRLLPDEFIDMLDPLVQLIIRGI